MIGLEVLGAYTVACIMIISIPGADNLLAISRGISQGWRAGMVSAFGAALGLMVHALATALGLAALLKVSASGFFVLKLIGAVYLLWLGYKTLRSKNMIQFEKSKALPMKKVFQIGFLTNVLNPKLPIFFLAFVPQFVSTQQGNVGWQILLLGTWLALLAFITFAIMGYFASNVATYLRNRPAITYWLNIGAGFTFILSGLSVALMDE